jgi:phosphoribosylformylglycinamidine synthase
VNVDLPADQELIPSLFAEELGCVIEVSSANRSAWETLIRERGLKAFTHCIGEVRGDQRLVFRHKGVIQLEEPLLDLHRIWSGLTYQMQRRRDNPTCAQQEYDRLLDADDPGLLIQPAEPVAFAAPTLSRSQPPQVAILREQGINGHNEMAFAFHRAGFTAVDVHMTDLLSGKVDLNRFQGLVACGGFSYGDVLGAGSGWAKSVLYHDRLKEMFATFFARESTFTLGVCNGCQMISQLKDIIPGAGGWPAFIRNTSEQFEARVVNVEVLNSPSLFLQNMTGAILPIPVAHGEGKARFDRPEDLQSCQDQRLISLRYVDGRKQPTEQYPRNPNGSPEGVTGFTTPDGRATIMMPHPERCFRSVQMSYNDGSYASEDGPWMPMFRNVFQACQE